MPAVRYELMTGIKSKLIPLGALDEFQSAGIFVNWWRQIRYDLKTIISSGWHHALIPDEYLIASFFKTEADAIERLEATISEAQVELAEAVETAQEVAAYEPEEDEAVTAAVIKKALKALIDDLTASNGASAQKERKALEAQERAIADLEKRIKESKTAVRVLTDELNLKLQLKRLGGEEYKAESQQLMRQVDGQITELDENNQDDKKKITALKKDKVALQARMDKPDAILASIGGQLTEEEAKALILKKLYDLANLELNRYLNAEKRKLLHGIEALWDKYAVSGRTLELERLQTLHALDSFLKELKYV